VIAEPIQGTAGNIVPPDGYITAIREIAKEEGAVYISDEMICGFGRTGYMFGVNHDQVLPDIMTVGKAMGNGFPVSGVITTDAHAQTKPWSLPSASSSSYGGNPLACAAAAASLRIIDEENLVENSKQVGEYFLSKLKPMQERYPFVGDVRGLGLFLSMELVKDKATKEPLSKKATNHIFMENLKRGLLTMSYAASFRIQPSMTIDKGTVDNVVSILTETFEQVAQEKSWQH
jgi:4-aminobutyrate aminotransferase-like enzyme